MSKPATPPPVPEKRAAPRTPQAVEVVLRCPDKSGKSFVEKTRTVDISRTGAKTLTEHDVNHGARLQMAIPHLKRMSSATVARVGNRTGNLQEIGIAIDETGDFWGVPLTDEMQAPRAAERVPQQGGTKPEASTAAAEMNPARALVEELLASTELKPAIPSVTLEQARSAMEQSLGEALQQLNEQAAVIMKHLLEVITEQTEDRLRQSVEAALRQVEAAALDITNRSQRDWEQRIQALTDSAQEKLRTQLTEQETHLAASAAASAVKLRRELARRLADLSKSVAED
ncbi:MAG: hypothetical protein A3H28_01815 [Acidobacteria bacterium RIFCSPLOWO2_02_FULL_61_28]|nr:MAG: hypothetical protein A3H28_01815 [Acidobacteria bacterium RIFCSPLOWO2_02_FULL_61_28]